MTHKFDLTAGHGIPVSLNTKCPALLNVRQERLLHDESKIKRTIINDEYDKIKGGNDVLGSGCNGQVTKLTNKETGNVVAMKQIPVSQKAAREVTLHLIASEKCDYITKVENVYLNKNHGKDYFYSRGFY